MVYLVFNCYCYYRQLEVDGYILLYTTFTFYLQLHIFLGVKFKTIVPRHKIKNSLTELSKQSRIRLLKKVIKILVVNMISKIEENAE